MARSIDRSGAAPSRRARREPESGDIGAVLVASLTLRLGGPRLRTRVYWPPVTPAARTSLTLLLVDCETPRDVDSADLLSRVLCTAAATTVLCASVRQTSDAPEVADRDFAVAALGWATEHAGDLGAHAGRILIVGQHTGAALAAWLAISARDSGWPRLCRQVLVHPTFTAACPMPLRVAGVAPATIISRDSPSDDGRRFVSRLRGCGIEVEELRRPDRALLGNGEEPTLLRADLVRTLLGPTSRLADNTAHLYLRRNV